MITLYDMELSGNAQKVRMALALLGLEYDNVAPDADYRASSDYRAMHPLGQVPVLIDGDHVVRESQAILAYLAAKHRPGDWDGRDAAERSEIALWLSHAANEISNGPGALRLKQLFGAAVDADKAAAVTERILPVIEAHLQGRSWLVGDRLTIADLAASPYIALAGDGGVDLDRWPAITAWLARIAALPAFPAMPGWDANPLAQAA